MIDSLDSCSPPQDSLPELPEELLFAELDDLEELLALVDQSSDLSVPSALACEVKSPPQSAALPFY